MTEKAGFNTQKYCSAEAEVRHEDVEMGCKHCEAVLSWCCVKWTTIHVACEVKMTIHCKCVSDLVWESMLHL